jgi:hypothetical protein
MGFVQNPIILKVIREAFFHTKNDWGIKHDVAFTADY